MQNCPDYLSWLPVPSNTQVYAVPGLICQTNQKIVTAGRGGGGVVYAHSCPGLDGGFPVL